jgi:hypothetical protein
MFFRKVGILLLTIVSMWQFMYIEVWPYLYGDSIVTNL